MAKKTTRGRVTKAPTRTPGSRVSPVTPGDTASRATGAAPPSAGDRGAAAVPALATMSQNLGAPAPDPYAQIAGPTPPNAIDTVNMDRNIWSPFQPVVPFGPPSVTYPRTYDYPVGINLDFTGQGRLSFFKMMQVLSRSWGILRAVIETRKDQLLRLPWDVQLKDKPKIKDHPRLNELRAFFKKPDRQNNFNTWMRLQLEDLFVIDAANYYVWKDRGGKPYGLMHVAGETIKPLLDDAGRRPEWPNPAFQQLVKGLPWVNLDAHEFVYAPMRPTPQEPIYGYSPVQQIYVEVLQGIRKMLYKLEYWTDGSIPQLMVTVPEGWTPEQLAAFQAHFDVMMAGNTPFKSRVRFMPSGSKPFDLKNANGEALKTDEDEWVARLVCYVFSVPPTPFIRQMNRATADNAQEEAEEEGLHPLMSWTKEELIDPAIQDPDVGFGYDDCEFIWLPQPEVDPQKQMTVITGYVSKGIITPDEGREQINMGPLPGGAGAEAVVETPAGPVPFKETVEAARQKALATPDQLANEQEKHDVGIAGQQQSQDHAAQNQKITVQQSKKQPPGGRPINKSVEEEARDDHGRWTAGLTEAADAVKEFVGEHAHGLASHFVDHDVILKAVHGGMGLAVSYLGVEGHITEAAAVMVAGYAVKEVMKATGLTGERAVDFAVGVLKKAGRAVISSDAPRFPTSHFPPTMLMAKVDDATRRGVARLLDVLERYDGHTLAALAPASEDELAERVADAERGAGGEVGKLADTPFVPASAGERLDALFGKRGGTAGTRWRRLAPASMARPAVARRVGATRKIVAAALKKCAAAAAAQVRGLRKSSRYLNEIEKAKRRGGPGRPPPAPVDPDAVAAMTFDLSALADAEGDVADELAAAAADAAAEMLAQVGIGEDDPIFDRVSERAVAAAQDQAAELVGGVDETTRGMLRDIITGGLEDNVGLDDIADQIAESAAFGDDRADLIARTEVRNANERGVVEGLKSARDAGNNVKKVWLLGPDPCEICQGNADDGPIDLDDVFSSGDSEPTVHPNCECAVTGEVGEDETSDEDVVEALARIAKATRDEARDSRGRWTSGSAPDNPTAAMKATWDVANKSGMESAAKFIGGTVDEVRDRLQQRVAAVTAASEPMIRMSPATFGKVLRSGEIMNQHQTGASSSTAAVQNPAYRRAGEETYHQVSGLSDADMPKYGFLAERGDPGHAASAYGSVAVAFKDGVRDRVTFTGGDSLNSSWKSSVPSRLTNPDFRTLGTSWRGLLDGDGVGRLGGSKTGYVEAQFWGPLKSGDIKTVYFKNQSDHDRFAPRLSALGISAGMINKLAKYDADQPRDARGRFGSGGASATPAMKLHPVSSRAFLGVPVALRTQMSKQEAGALGEKIAVAYLRSTGMDDARPLNAARPNYPVDVQGDHSAVEVKTGLVSNSPGAQQWRATIGEPGEKEKAWLRTASDDQKASWNAKKSAAILARKNAVVRQLSRDLGREVRPRTVAILLNPDRRVADIHVLDGFHARLGWRSPEVATTYVGSYKY